MYTYLIGYCDEVRPLTRVDKKSGETISTIDVTVTFESNDQDGYLIKSTETISFDAKLKPKFDSVKGKFIAIPYRFLNTRTCAYMFPDDSLDFQVFSKNPFISKEVTK